MVKSKSGITFDAGKINQAVIFIVLGVSLRIALAGYANIEPVLAIAIIAGLVLGGVFAFFIPLAIMVLSDIAIYTFHLEGTFGWKIILGISFFTWTGMMFAGYVGTKTKPKLLFTIKGIGVFTGIAVIVTIIYDLWTVVGTILLIPWASVGEILIAQIPFSIYHILSTLIFVPLFGTGYYYLIEYGLPDILGLKKVSEMPDDET
ncbi:MAG: hypothetical protein KAR56_00880 [Thermoplasmata archaeon]|nr:hypothetical protein [Thermoplasmata archaeon]